jgi:transcriptional regulator
MYTPPAFRDVDRASIHAMIEAAGLATLVTMTGEGLVGTPLPLLLAPDEGPLGTLYGHVARANPQWRLAATGEALAIFAGPDAYVSPSWYATKGEHGRVVPTWNYAAVHAYGTAEFFEDPVRLRGVVGWLTDRHEAGREEPWSVGDAPEPFVQAQLKGIVGVRLPIARLEGKRKFSQNRSAADRVGVAAGLRAEGAEAAAAAVPLGD